MQNSRSNANTVVVLDFETTGLSPGLGDRAIEIGAVRIEDGTVTARFQELMNPGQRVSGFIESYTGITNAMLANARPCAQRSCVISPSLSQGTIWLPIMPRLISASWTLSSQEFQRRIPGSLLAL